MEWKEILEFESRKQYFQNLMKFVEEEYQTKTIYPPKKLMFNAFKLTPFENVKVVIIGQDPYHNEGQAMGLAFSVPKGVELPPSLQNIYREIENEYHQKMSQNGDLTYLAKQGVFLLNTKLTVEKNKPLSHKDHGYEVLIKNVVRCLNKDNNPKVFLLWGSEARSYKMYIDNPHHLVLESPHPSPLSAYRGFFGNNHFIKANEFLKKNNLTEINFINK